MSEGPFKMRAVANESMAANEVYRVFGQDVERVDGAQWGDFIVTSRDTAGRSHTRVVELDRTNQRTGRGRDSMGAQIYNRQSLISEMRRAPYAMPSMEVGNITFADSVSGRKPEVTLEERDESYLLQALDQLSGRLLHLDSGLAMRAANLHQEITEHLKGRERERKAEARAEFDDLTQQGRQALEHLRKLEGERGMVQDDRNRAITKLNGAKQKMQVVKAQRPHDDDFPSLQQIDDWQAKFAAATAEADELQRQVSDLTDDYRRQGGAVAIAKQQVNRIRGERDAARRRAGIKPPSASDDGTEEVLNATA